MLPVQFRVRRSIARTPRPAPESDARISSERAQSATRPPSAGSRPRPRDACQGPVNSAQKPSHAGSSKLAPDYRLTPEHPHPAQAEDALGAWHHVAATAPPGRIVVIGDSAGGHMALMLLQSLRAAGLPQPALCIGLCPWTDIGARGASLTGNDPTDLVQGWMALRFGEWLDPKGSFGHDSLSPIAQDFTGLAPIYLQAGGREVLRDMIRDFAESQATRGAAITLDEWPDMPHDFQAYDSLTRSSTEALQHIVAEIGKHVRTGEL